MEVSPAKSLEVISDSEGEGDHVRANDLHQLQHDPNVGILPVSRDWHIHPATATMSSYNPSSHISPFPTMPPAQPQTPISDSSIQPGSERIATNPRPRPRMRPIPPPDDPDTSISAFSTNPPALAQPPTDTVSSFGNSAVQDVPNARPPSLPPSSLPAVDSSSSMLQPTFPIALAPQENARPKSKSKSDGPVKATMSAASSSTIASPAISVEPLAFPSSKRPRPKMRPPPPPEPSASTSTTAPSVAATDSGSNLNANPSTSATSNSANSKTSSAQQRSALDDAEEYTGRGARRLAQLSKPQMDDYIDVGGPDDEIIMLIDSSDTEQRRKIYPPFLRFESGLTQIPAAKSKTKPKKKPAPKQAKKPVPTETEASGAHHESSSRVPLATAGGAKRRSPQPQTSEDELGRWDIPIPGEPSSILARTTSAKKRRKAAIQDSDDEAANPLVPPYVPDTIAPLGNPPSPPRPPLPSSPLSSPGHSPAAKRKLEPNSTLDEGLAPTSAKRPRKSVGKMEVVLRAPVGQGDSSKKAKAKPKGKGKSTPAPPVESSNGTEGQGHTSSALEITTGVSPSGLIPESSKGETTSQPANDGAGSNTAATTMDVDLPSTEVDPAPTTAKKPKKRAAKSKKGAASEVAAAEGSVEVPSAGAKKSAKNKGKSKAKEVATTASSNDVGTPPIAPDATSSNPDTGIAASSSNPSAGGNLEAGSSNPLAPNQTPAPKSSRPKPRHSTTPAPMPVAMGASGALLQTTGRKSSDRPLSETLRLALGGTGTPPPRMGLSRRGSSKIAPLLAFRGAPPPPPPPMPKKPVRKKKGQSDDEDSEEGSEWEKLTEKQKEKKRREKEVAGWYSD
ncbi:hypothetical protein FRC06_003385 [Ceratobasidium sp. 370]|nr:hypothetical protein FRC06_003385 [Ceratobasidium sp. 370]